MPHGLTYCHLPLACASRKDFFVKTHNSEPALAPGFCVITPFLLEQKEAAHYCSSAPRFLMHQESNKHFVRTEKPALLSEDREVREPGRPFTGHKRDTPHKAGLRRLGGGLGNGWEEIICTCSLAHQGFTHFTSKSDLGRPVSRFSCYWEGHPGTAWCNGDVSEKRSELLNLLRALRCFKIPWY